jgi:hypothetical protein
MGPVDAEITRCDFSPRFLLVRFLCAKENEQPKLILLRPKMLPSSQRPAPAPAPAPAQPTMSSGVTGSLTRGNEGGGTPDESAEANALFKKMFG